MDRQLDNQGASASPTGLSPSVEPHAGLDGSATSIPSAAYRTKWMDPDFRRDAKTAHYCGVCQRDLKPGQPYRIILFRFDHYEAVHNEDWQLAIPEGHSGEGFIMEPIGMDCAKKLGLEWSREKGA